MGCKKNREPGPLGRFKNSKEKSADVVGNPRQSCFQWMPPILVWSISRSSVRRGIRPWTINSPLTRNYYENNFSNPSKPHPCNMPQAKTEVALQFLESCAAEVALQHSVFCNADIIFTKSCAATSEKLHCNSEKASLQKSGAFLPLSRGFQAPTFRTRW